MKRQVTFAAICTLLLSIAFAPSASALLFEGAAMRELFFSDPLSGSLDWWLYARWFDYPLALALTALTAFGITFVVGVNMFPDRGQEGGPLGSASIVRGKSAVRKASDLWNGYGEPAGSGLVYGFDGTYYTYEAASPHSLLVSTTGSMKTRGAIMPTIDLMAAAGNNIVVSDVKDELIELMGDGLEEQGYRVLLLDCQHPTRGNRYNPLALVNRYAELGDEQSAEQAADEIAAALIPSGSDGGPDHWAESARALVAASILAVALSDECPREAKTLESVARLINEGTEAPGADPCERLKAYFRSLPVGHPARSFASQFLSSGGNELRSIVSTAKVRLRIFTSRNIAWMTSGTPEDPDVIDVERVLSDKTALFLHVMDEGSPYNSIFSVFFDQLYKALYLVCDSSGGRLPRETDIIGDEWGNLPVVRSLPALTSLGRSMGLRWHGAVQNLAQLNKYGKDGDRKKIIANCGVKMALRLGEAEDCQYFSDLVGKTTKHTESRSSTKSHGGGSAGTSYNEVADYPIHPWEWRERSASRDGSIVCKSAEEGAPASHAGVLNPEMADITKTPAADRYAFGTREEEAAARREYQERLAKRAAAVDVRTASWFPAWPEDPQLEDSAMVDDEWSAFD